MTSDGVQVLEVPAIMPTSAQLAVLVAVVREYRTNGGWPVPVRRACDLAGRTSTSTVHTHLRTLTRIGLVEQSPYTDRAGRGAYRPTPLGASAVAIATGARAA